MARRAFPLACQGVTGLNPAHDLALPDALRARLAKPFGPVVQASELRAALTGAKRILAVGDVVSLNLKRLGIEPHLFVCDLKTQRGEPSDAFARELASWGKKEIRVRNPAGGVTLEAWRAVAEALASKETPVRILVEGEEDLVGIACFAEAKRGDVVVYGLPGKGAVVARVDAPLKAFVAQLVADMLPA